MTDSINRTTANEEAARAAQQAQLKKTKQTDKATQMGSQNKALQDKAGKSAFDDMLSQMSEPDNPMAASQENKFDSKIKEYSRDDDHSSSEQDAEDDAKPKDKTDSSKKSKDSQLESHERVVAKHQSGEG